MSITKQEFLSSIRTKYPSYQNVDDVKLYDSITTKYPQYKDQIQDDGIQQDTNIPINQAVPQQNTQLQAPTIEKQPHEKRLFSDEKKIVETMTQE